MRKPQAIVVLEEACPQEGWDDAVREKVLRLLNVFAAAPLGAK